MRARSAGHESVLTKLETPKLGFWPPADLKVFYPSGARILCVQAESIFIATETQGAVAVLHSEMRASILDPRCVIMAELRPWLYSGRESPYLPKWAVDWMEDNTFWPSVADLEWRAPFQVFPVPS
jgi:hypothetical protein